MNRVIAPDQRDRAEAPRPLSVLLLYESAPAAVRAKHLMDRLVEHVNLIVSFRLNLCRFDLLSVPGVGSASLQNDMLFLAAEGLQDLPPTVWSWLERWLAQDYEQPRAVVLSLDENARDLAIANHVQYFLSAAACRAGVDVFVHFGQTRYGDKDSTLGGLGQRAAATSTLLEETLKRRNGASFRFWGIND